MAYLMRMTGDSQRSSDIMQESFTRFLERYGPRSGNGPLLFKIARNAALDDARQNRRFSNIDSEELRDHRDQEGTILERESFREVIAAMQRLEKTEREILVLVVSRNLSYRQVAEMMGLSESNVRVKIHRARVKLKEILQKEPPL